ncbi:MAG: processive 1,2-diacylglycerol beta-glucosyltransferase [Thermoleophilaceae bacterium]|nr:processive 1,2-diacylglycerol beta-glucosyltransferase [Thermoleophilaceae bacterium]
MIRDGVLRAQPDAVVEIRDSVAEAGGLIERLVGQEVTVEKRWLDWLYDLQYWLFFRVGPVRRVITWLGTRLGAPTILRLIAEAHPDVVVSTYPGSTEILGRLRQRGEVHVPVVSAITDLAALRLWAHPGVDLHLITHEESIDEVRAIAPQSRIVWARGMTTPAFETPVDQASARAELGLPASGAVAIVSGGGWGVGDMEGAIATALEVSDVATVVVLCGRSKALEARLGARFGGDERVQLWGFTERMSDLMGAADVLIHSTAGLTVLEAWIRGCRSISYGWGIAHIRLNNRAFERYGIAQVAPDRPALRAALGRALAAPRVPHPEYGALPSAADEVLALAR